MDFTAYQYDINGIYIGVVECQRDPKRNMPLLPGSCTKIQPPEIKENEIAVFKNDSWEVKTLKKEKIKISSFSKKGKNHE